MPNDSAAFFDLDRTLMSGSSAMQFALAARREGMIGRSEIMRWGFDHLYFRAKGSTDQSTDMVVSRVKLFIQDLPEVEIVRMAPQLIAGILTRLYPEMVEEVRMHQDAGRPTFIISAAADGLVAILARILGMDGGRGTRYCVDEEGKLTGELDGPLMYGDGKLAALDELAAEHGVDLGASWAYSDSVSDLPMLMAVGNAVAVNPDDELAAVAQEHGWQVMRFERLGRRLVLSGAVVVTAAAGGAAWL
ncbi:MAG: HAD family hydrolase, partial [Solirubrobacterales bacterium]